MEKRISFVGGTVGVPPQKNKVTYMLKAVFHPFNAKTNRSNARLSCKINDLRRQYRGVQSSAKLVPVQLRCNKAWNRALAATGF